MNIDDIENNYLDELDGAVTYLKRKYTKKLF